MYNAMYKALKIPASPIPRMQVLEAMSKAFKSGGNLDVNSAKVVKLDPIGAKFA